MAKAMKDPEDPEDTQRLRSEFQDPYGSSQLSIAPIPGDPMPPGLQVLYVLPGVPILHMRSKAPLSFSPGTFEVQGCYGLIMMKVTAKRCHPGGCPFLSYLKTPSPCPSPCSRAQVIGCKRHRVHMQQPALRRLKQAYQKFKASL